MVILGGVLFPMSEVPLCVDHMHDVRFGQGIGELAGFGHGLGLSRLYARYWGGDIQVSPAPLCRLPMTASLSQLLPSGALLPMVEYRGISPARKCTPLGPYRRPMSRVLEGS